MEVWIVNKQAYQSMRKIFGHRKATEKIRTQILFVSPYGSITVPDVDPGPGLKFCAARIGDDKFYQEGYWANWGPKPSDEDPDVFVVPVALRPYMEGWCNNWSVIIDGDFVITESGVIVLDVQNMFAWEGYVRPGKRDAGFDRRRLEKSAKELKVLFP